VSERTQAGVLTNFENRSGAGVNFFKEGPEPESFYEYEVCLSLIVIIAGCFFYKACYNVNFKCEKLLHRKSKNLKQLECKQG